MRRGAEPVLGSRRPTPPSSRSMGSERAVMGFSELEGVEPEVAEALVGEGFLSYDDLSVIEPDDLMAMGDLTEEQVDKIVSQAEEKAEEAEVAAKEERQRQRERERLDKERAAAAEAAGIAPDEAGQGEESGVRQEVRQE